MIGIGLGVVSALGAAGQFASGLMSSRARRAEFDEQIRATMMKRDQTVGLAMSRAAASGTEAGSRSTTDYLRALSQEFGREVSALRDARRVTGTADTIANVSGLVSSGANIYGRLGELNNWWRK